MCRSPFRLRWLAGPLCAAGCSLLSAGCAETAAEQQGPLPVVRVFQVPPNGQPTSVPAAVAQGGYTSPEQYPPANRLMLASHQTTAMAGPTLGPTDEPLPPPTAVPGKLPAPALAETKTLPINLDTVFRLAEQHNVQIGLAREKLHESEAEECLAAKAWLPQVFAGVGYYRHEGGIQNPDGTLINASWQSLFPGVEVSTEIDLREATYQRINAARTAWQQRGELSKVTSETLLEAATTYIDLLTARRGRAIAMDLDKNLMKLLESTEKLAAADRSAQVVLEAVRGEAAGRRQTITRLRQQGDAAAAKLAYLLGLGSDVTLVPVEEALTPIDLVDATPPLNELVARAITAGPGVRELQNLLTTIQDGLNQMSGALKYMPTFQLGMIEGPYGGGTDGTMSFANRFDAEVQMRWNITEFLTARDKRRVAESKIEQARLTYDDLRGKLTAGVEEARESVLSGREQIVAGADQVKHSAEAYRLSEERLRLMVPGASNTEVLHSVLQAIKGMETAHTNYLTAINSYNKAQIRLLVLLGPVGAGCGTAACEPKR